MGWVLYKTKRGREGTEGIEASRRGLFLRKLVESFLAKKIAIKANKGQQINDVCMYVCIKVTQQIYLRR